MQLLTDFLSHLEDKNHITGEIYKKVHLEGNMAINSDHPDPFKLVIDLLVSSYSIEQNTVDKALELVIANSSAISYLHMGRPETILIDTEERLKQQIVEVFGANKDKG